VTALITSTIRLLVLDRAVEEGVNFVDPDDLDFADTAVWVPLELWRMMGEPNSITVTICPGDHLNLDT
jgi:hypothetical protein